MKMFKTLFWVGLVLTTASFSVAQGSDIFGIDSPVRLIIEPVPMPNTAGSVNLRLTVISTSPCEDATIAITGIDNLQYLGDTSWTYKTVAGDTNIIDLALIIPDNDTSGIGITTRCTGWPNMNWQTYFTANSEGVKFYNASPRGFRKAHKKLIDMSDPPTTEEQRQGKSAVGYYDEERNWVPEDSVKNGLSPSGKPVGFFNEAGIFISLDSLHELGSGPSPDSTAPVKKEGDRSKTWLVNPDGSRTQVDRQWLLDSLKQAKTEAKLAEMHRLEETPLKESDKQYFDVDGKTYRRLRGEYKFHLVETTTDPIGYAEKYRDSLNIAKGKVFEFNFDLRDSTHLEYAKTKIDNLAPTDSTGFYRATIDWQTVLDLQKKGIVFHKIGWKPREDR